MTRHTTRWKCPKCGQTITTHIPVIGQPTCEHWATGRTHKPTPMEPTDD